MKLWHLQHHHLLPSHCHGPGYQWLCHGLQHLLQGSHQQPPQTEPLPVPQGGADPAVLPAGRQPKSMLSLCCSCSRGWGAGGTGRGKTDKNSSLAISAFPASLHHMWYWQEQWLYKVHAVSSVLIKSHCHFYLLKILPSQSARSAHVGTI